MGMYSYLDLTFDVQKTDEVKEAFYWLTILNDNWIHGVDHLTGGLADLVTKDPYFHHVLHNNAINVMSLGSGPLSEWGDRRSTLALDDDIIRVEILSSTKDHDDFTMFWAWVQPHIIQPKGTCIGESRYEEYYNPSPVIVGEPLKWGHNGKTSNAFGWFDIDEEQSDE